MVRCPPIPRVGKNNVEAGLGSRVAGLEEGVTAGEVSDLPLTYR